MDFEEKLEEIRTELNSMSKKIIKLRFAYKSLKKSYLGEIAKEKAKEKKLEGDLLYASKYYKDIERFLKD